MRKLIALGATLAIVLFAAGSAVAETWSTEDGDFAVKFWKEMFKGGGPGQPGNTLMALGQGFNFRQATLESVVYDGTVDRYITTYVGGKLVLNSQGPWLNFGKLKATDITATNSSHMDHSTGVLDFVLTFSGTFKNHPGVSFEVEARYTGVPEVKYDMDGDYEFQRGYDYSVDITITGLRSGPRKIH